MTQKQKDQHMRTLATHLNRTLVRMRSVIAPRISSLIDTLYHHTARDTQWIIIILLLAALVRFPALAHPHQTNFDEPIYADFVILTLQQQPFFDIHPPLARIIFTTIAQCVSYTPFHTTLLPTPTTQAVDFGDFPYVPLRATVAFFGTLLPLLIYGCGRLLSYRPRVAGLIALFVVIDPALIVYARAILPDTLLLTFEFAGIFCALLAARTIAPKNVLLWSSFAALFLGLAVSIKWVSLAVIALVCLLYVLKRYFTAIALTLGIVCCVYVAVFSLFLGYFPNGGTTEPVLLTYNTEYITNQRFPVAPTLREKIAFLAPLHHDMWRANTDSNVSARLPVVSSPLAWPVAKVNTTGYGWWDTQGPQILLKGNDLLWNLAFFLFIFDLTWIGVFFMRTKTWMLDRNEFLLLVGYIANYIPFFLIARPMYLYHYFTALLFLFLLIPRVAPRVIHCIALLSNDKLFARVLGILVVILIFLTSLLSAPTIYGF